jgi:AcrR family transcriptional regulator
MARSRAASAKTKKTAPATGKSAPSSAHDARKVRSLERREAILAAALEEFSTRGFEATRLDDVAKRAKIAKGTIYLYFRDKESLFQELIRDMLTPIIGTVKMLGAVDAPLAILADRLVDMFVREVYETPRREIVRLMITEGRRFPKVAEFYYREVLSHIIAAVRAILRRAAARGEVSAALVDFPQILVAPGLVAIIWSGLFERFEPLDVRAMMKTHVDLLLAPRKAS